MSMAQSQRALHFVAKRVARVRWGGDLRLARERERELHGVSRPGALDEHVDATVGELPGARPVALEGPGSGRRREAHRDGLLAPAGKVELLALEPDRIERARVGKAPSGLAHGEDAVDAKGALRIAAEVVADGVPDASVIDHALRTEHALARGAPPAPPPGGRRRAPALPAESAAAAARSSGPARRSRGRARPR